MQSYKICENITLHHIPMMKFKTTGVGIYIGRSLKKEEASLNAVLPYILIKGTECAKKPSDLAKALQNLYGASLSAGVSKRGDNQFINFEGEVIADRYAPEGEKLLEGLMSIMLSVVFSPLTENGAFLTDITQREKANCIDKIKGIINDKTRYADKRCREEMFKGEAYSISEYGYIDEIENLTPAELYSHYLKLVSESEINIFVCGEVDIAATAELISRVVSEKVFKKAVLSLPQIIKSDRGVREIRENTELVQGKLSIGFRTNISCNDPEFWALVVANNIYGGGLGSKLFNNVREKLSLAYYVSTTLDKYKGFMLLHAGIAFDKFDEAKNEIFLQLDNMKNGAVSDSELDNAKSEIINGINSCYDDYQLLQSYYMGNIIAGTEISPEEYKENIRRVTKREVIAAISKLELDTVYFLEN